MDAPQASSVSGSDLISVLQSAGFAFATVDLINAGPLAQVAALQAVVAALAARVGAVETRPEEVAHFGASAAMPTVAIGASFVVTLTNLAPARAGDALKAGESVAVQPLAVLPDGVTMRGPPTVPADGTVLLRFTSSVALTGATPIPWAISALR